MGNTKTTTAELAVIEPVRVELIIPEEIEINGLKISNKIIQDKIKEVKLIKINGVDDRENYDLAVKKLSECVKLRTQAEAWRKENVKPVLAGLSTLKERIDGFGEEAQKGEEYLRGIIKPIDDAKEKIKKDKEEAKLKVMQGRISEITALGAQFDGLSVYTFPYDPGLLINAISLKDWDVAEFSEFLEEVKTSWVCEQERIANEQAEADRKAQEIADQAEQNKVQEKANQDKRTALRLKELKLMGFYFDGASHLHRDVEGTISVSAVENWGDDDWDKIIEEFNNAIELASLPQIAEPEVTPEVDLPEVEALTDDELDRLDNTLVASEIPYTEDTREFTASLYFNTEYPFKEVEIGKKFRLRLFPAVLEDLNVLDPDCIATEGEIEGDLRFILIKK